MNATICPLFGLILLSISSVHAKTDLNCSLLLSGQYVCDPPPIDRRTQQPANCSKVNLTAPGCLKLATVGGFGLWYLADILLLATGKFEPSDGSSLWYPYYDPPVTLLERSNMTVFVG
ncbi:unnamed protein product [Calicophoron daubneyi]|uniref:Uncharacterized protein n=1 Tax=Calicophoron daubneyi TaxID=300641 RepID=A0AAV2TJP2_CALDB